MEKKAEGRKYIVRAFVLPHPLVISSALTRSSEKGRNERSASCLLELAFAKETRKIVPTYTMLEVGW